MRRMLKKRGRKREMLQAQILTARVRKKMQLAWEGGKEAL